MPSLQRITTQYIQSEDRMKLSGEAEDKQLIVLWLTQRILKQILAHLLDIVEKSAPELAKTSQASAPAKNLVQEFAQQSARAKLRPEPPVQATSNSCLVNEVQISLDSDKALLLTFKGNSLTEAMEDSFTLSLSPTRLRQWLGIVYSNWRRAEWEQSIWPTWMEDAPATVSEDSLH